MTEDNNSISTKITFKHWQKMPLDERDFFVFRSLQTIQEDVCSLKKRRLVRDPLYAIFGGIVGGVTFMAANAKIKLLGG